MSRLLVSQAAWNTLAGLLTQGAGFLSAIIVARYLGPGGSGAVALLVLSANAFVLLTNLGLPAALTRFIPEFQARGDSETAHSLAVFLLSLVSRSQIIAAGIVLAAGLWLTNYELGNSSSEISPALFTVITACFGLLLGSQTAFSSYLIGMQKFSSITRLCAYTAATQLVLVSLGTLAFGFLGAVVGYALASLPGAIMSLTLLRSPVAGATYNSPRVFSYARKLWLAQIVSAIVWTRMDLFLLGLWNPIHVVGLYTAAISFANLAVQVPLMVSGVLVPHFAAQRVDPDPSQLYASYRQGSRLFAFIVLPMSLGGAAISPILVPLLYGPQFAAAADVASIVLIAAGIATIASVGSALLLACERPNVSLTTDMAGAVAFVAAGLLIMPSTGLIGAAWIRLTIQCSVIAAQVWYIQRRLLCRVPVAELARLFLAAAASALAARSCLLALSGPAALPLAVITGGIVYAISVRLLRALPQRDVDQLRLLSRLLPGPLQRTASLSVGFLCRPA